MKKMKKIYDGPRIDYSFKIGEYVLLWDHRKRADLKLSKSLLLRWRGPFRVVQILSPTNYRLQYVLDESLVCNSHVIHMRPFDGSLFQGRRKEEVLSGKETEELIKTGYVDVNEEFEAHTDSNIQGLRDESDTGQILRRSVRIAERLNKH
jgi:hypothetical protein